MGGGKEYFRKNNDLHIGGAKLEGIVYEFWRGKFGGVWVITEGFTNWSSLKDAVFEKFGKGFQFNESIKFYVWFGNITTISLGYNKDLEKGRLNIFSTKTHEQQEAYDKQKAKEGAETGF